MKSMDPGRIIENAVLDLRGALSLPAEKTNTYSHDLNGSYSHVMSPELRKGSFARQEVTAQTVRRHLLQHDLSARLP